MEVKHFNNVQISYSADGIGAKGVISQQLSFNVPAAEYGSAQGLYGSEIIVSCGLSLPKFYVYSAKPNGVNIAFVCYDRAMFTSNTLTVSEDSFYTALTSEPSNWKTGYKNYYTKSDDGYSAVTGSSAPEFSSGKYYSYGDISVQSVLDNITAVCGFEYINTGDIIGNVITRMPKDSVINKNAKAVLSELAEASAGCFFVQENGSLAFLPYVGGSFSAEFPVEKYDRVCYGLSKGCDGIILQNGSKVYSSGGGSGAFGTMCIDTVYASSALLGALMSSYRGKTYTGWKCENALVSYYPAPGAGIKFGDSDTALVCNFCRIKLTDGGFFASMGRNEVSESEYISQYTRALSERVKVGETNGNTKITRDGVKLVFVNENKKSRAAGDEDTEEYGFKVSSGGVTEFSGAMLSAVQPVGKIEDTADNVVSFLGKLGDKTFRWKAVEGDDGTVSLSREEVISDG